MNHQKVAPDAGCMACRILVVEDDPGDVEIVRRYLAEAPALRADVEHAGRLAEGCAKLRRGGFHAVLLDLGLPDSIGLDGLAQLHEIDPAVPIIVFTGLGDDATGVAAIRQGAADYLVKGRIGADILARAVHYAIERGKMLQDLHLTTERYRHVIEATEAIPYTWDTESRRFLYVGSQAVPLLGYPIERWTDERFWDSVVRPDERADAIAARCEPVKAVAGRPCEYPVSTADGRTKWMRDVVKVETGGDGRRIAYGLMFDISDSKHRDAQLLQAQKMEAIGQLTGGIAHDFNNLLTVIIGNLDLLQEALEPNPNAQEMAKLALKASLRGSDLTSQLLAFSRRQSLEVRAIDLNELVSGTIGLLQRTLGEQIDIEVSFADDLWPASADPTQLEAALTNLAINARDAMPDGGRLIIEMANTHLNEHCTAENVEFVPGDYVMLTVSDTGTGIPPEVREKVFEPFFTTKEDGKGTGLGLSMVYGFVKQSGGHIELHSVVGRGTTIQLYLPRVQTELAAVAASPPEHRVQETSGATVLVVEDNPEVRQVVVNQLSSFGHEVVEAGDGAAALEILTRHEAIDLLFTDIVMPGGMSGLQLAEKARELRPKLKILFTSGFAEAALQNGVRTRQFGPLLSKPYRVQALARSIQAALQEMVE